MNKVTFITGNPAKAEFLAKYLGHPVDHKKIDLDEIQSLDLKEITKHKARQAFDVVGLSVLVEDTGCSLSLLGNFPGPFIKWFLQEVGLEGVCRLVDGKDRGAVADICFCYFDGQMSKFFVGSLKGTIPEYPRGESGFGWDSIFIPFGQTKTYAEMDEAETEKYSLRTTTVYPQIKKFLLSQER